MELRTLVTFRSNKFNTSESKSNYINPCCFGDDVAEWLAQQLAISGAAVDPKIGQEDFGWYLGFQCGSERYPFALVLGYNPDGYWMGWLERQRRLLGSLFGARKRGIQPHAAKPFIRHLHDRKPSLTCVGTCRKTWSVETGFGYANSVGLTAS